MSSLKRLSVMAAFSHFNGHDNHNNKNYNSSSLTTSTEKSHTSITTTLPKATEVAISSFVVNSAYNQSNISSSPQIGGLGLLHQQNLRSGTINGGGVGAFGGSYSTGSWSGGAPVMGGGSSGNGGNGLGGGSSDGAYSINGNVNILLGGAMLSVVTTVLCVVCYCCHRNIKKRTEAAYRQRWMENDTNNMEIYSVEQCYETSGLFLESSEGLAVPALSHEPPPSYDAVMVAMQETTQHQHHHNHHQHLHSAQPSRISPPPDYRSMNDVSGSSGNANGNSKFITNGSDGGGGGGGAGVGVGSIVNKKVLNAQSCCSLQRAEAENLFQLGVVAAAAAAASSAGRFGASALGMKSLPYAAAAAAAHSLAENRYVNTQAYYQGCPLCGKFRYDDSMSLSSDSGLDQVVVTVDVNNGNTSMSPTAVSGDNETCYCTPLQSPTVNDEDQGNNNANGTHVVSDDQTRISTDQLMISPSLPQHQRYENAINNNNSMVDNTPTADGAIASTTFSSSLSPATISSASQAATVEESTSVVVDNNCRHTTTAITTPTPTDDDILDLDSINDNGIIRLDMSKIIDKTGLPTYEAALKLESSGYV